METVNEQMKYEDTDWWRRVETDSQGRDSFAWSFTFHTSFKKFREEAKNDRAYSLELFDLFDQSRYRITAGELSDGLRHELNIIVPPAQGSIQRRDELRREHPKWNIVMGRQTRGSNTPFIQIPVEFVRQVDCHAQSECQLLE